MRIVLSRKGFDSSAGGGPSPILEGRPVSLPIPAGAFSATSYADLGLGAQVERATRGRIPADALCHHDPLFTDGGECFFGQCGAAQTHLVRQRVGPGDVFLFFGLFREGSTGEPHHRIFGFLEVEAAVAASDLRDDLRAKLTALDHPHVLGPHGSNDTIYLGRGVRARSAHPALRLTAPGGPPSLWAVPPWLAETGLSYHSRPERWLAQGRLQSVARGQEFVADMGARKDARAWLARMVELIDKA